MFKSIAAPVVLVSVLWISFSVFSSVSLNTMIQSHERALLEDVSTIESAWAMRRDTWKLQATVLETALVDSPAAQEDIKRLEDDFHRSLREARRTSLTPAEAEAVSGIESRFERYARRVDELVARTSAGVFELNAAEKEELQALATEVTTACRGLSDINEKMIREATARNTELYGRVGWIRIWSTVVGPAAGLLMGLWFLRRFRKSISTISAKLNVVDGALCEEPTGRRDTSDELPELGRQAEVIASHVKTVVEELERTRKQAIQHERLAAVGELAAGMAHEIRNPLTSVKLLIQHAAQPSRGLSDRQRDVLLQEISRMEALVEDLLNFAKPPKLRAVRHDVRQTLRRALTLVEGRARQRNVQVENTAMPPQEVILLADPEQLLLVFVNLAINGIEAVEGGKLSISLAQAGQVCRVTFTDTGPGIAPEVQSRLFEPFVTIKERGTGLGLAICRRVVIEHGGTISGENLPEGGARFKIDLPLDVPIEHEDAVAAVHRRTEPPRQRPGLAAGETLIAG